MEYNQAQVYHYKGLNTAKIIGAKYEIGISYRDLAKHYILLDDYISAQK